MRPVYAVAALALGCPNPNPYQGTAGGYALVYNNGDQAIEASVDRLPRLDCGLLLEHPGLAADLPANAPEPYTLEPRYPEAPWESTVFSTDENWDCLAGRVIVDDAIATMVYDLRRPYQEIPLPATLDKLTYNTLVIDEDRTPKFNDGGQGALATPENRPPACELPPFPTWSGRSSSGTLLAIETQGACTVLHMAGEGNDVELCAGPALNFLVGEDLVVRSEETVFSVATASGGKPVLIGTLAEHLPSYLQITPLTDDGVTLVHPDACSVPTPCGPTVSADLLLVRNAFESTELSWGEAALVNTPHGATRQLRLHYGGAPIRTACGAALAFTYTAPPPG